MLKMTETDGKLADLEKKVDVGFARVERADGCGIASASKMRMRSEVDR